MPEFMLDDGYIGLIRAMDLHDAAIEMARKLGIRGEVRTMVGKWEEGGQITGWTKQSKAGSADVLLEVFASKLDDEQREFDSYVRMYAGLRDAAVLAHNVLTGLAAGAVEWEAVREPVERIRAVLGSASGMEAAIAGETPKSGSTEGDSPAPEGGDAQQ